MRPDVLFVAEMIEAATRIVALSADCDAHAVDQDVTTRGRGEGRVPVPRRSEP